MSNETYGTGRVVFTPTEKKLVWVSNNLIYAEIALPLEARILEIGGGNDPHPAANVVLDKFIDDNAHRMDQSKIIVNTTFVFCNESGEIGSTPMRLNVVQGDILDIPFPDKSFDFIITRHILEHIDDLKGALREISRVGKGGFIEVPKMESEMLFPQGAIHLWTFDDSFRARSIVGFQSPFGMIMHNLFRERGDIRRAWAEAYHYFHLCLQWNDSIDCEIVGRE